MRALPVFGLLGAFLLVKCAGNPGILSDQLVVGNPLLTDDGGGKGLLDLTPALGGLIVCVFYWFKFNEWAGEGNAPAGFHPRPARHFTTGLRYLGWNSFYGLLMVTSYLVIVFFPEFVIRMVNAWASASAHFNAPLPGVKEGGDLFNSIPLGGEPGTHQPPSPIDMVPYAVMLTTVVWSGMRPFSAFERRFRLQLQEHAAIPTEARQLVETFDKDDKTFHPEEETKIELVDHLGGRTLDLEDFEGSDKDLWFRYARVEYLNHLLLKYNRKPIFSRLAERYLGEFEDLGARMLRLRERVAERIADAHEFMCEKGEDEGAAPRPTLRTAERWFSDNLNQASDPQRRYIRTQRKELETEIDAAWRTVVQLIVCGVLAVGRSPVQRRDLLQAFGLSQPERVTIQLDLVTTIWVAGGAVMVVFLCSTIYYWWFVTSGITVSLGGAKDLPEVPKDLPDVLLWAVCAGLMHLLATLGGYSVQRSIESRRERLLIGKRRPLMPRAQVAEAVWSASFGFSLNVLLLGALLAAYPDPDRSFQDLAEYWWWAAVPGVTAFFAAIYTQKVERPPRQCRQLMLLQGACTGLAALLVFLLLYPKALFAATGTGNAQEQTGALLAFGLYTAVASTTVGLALGRTLREWVEAEWCAGVPEKRRAKRRRLKADAQWRAGSAEESVRVVSISASGAEFISPQSIPVGSEGTITLARGELRSARVVRCSAEDPPRIYVEFLEFMEDVA